MKKGVLILSLMALFLAGFVYGQSCNDGIECTIDVDYGGYCYNNPDNARCLKNQICNPTQGCIYISCVSDSDCDRYNNSLYNDGLYCTGAFTSQTCNGQYCILDSKVDITCDDPNICTLDLCVEASDECINIPTLLPENCFDWLDNDCDTLIDRDDPDCIPLYLEERLRQLEQNVTSLKGETTDLNNRVSILEAWKILVDSTLSSLQQQIDNIANNFCTMVNACPAPVNPCQQACSNNGYAESSCRNSCAGPWGNPATEGDAYCSPKVCCCK